jgi:hypothetical protein
MIIIFEKLTIYRLFVYLFIKTKNFIFNKKTTFYFLYKDKYNFFKLTNSKYLDWQHSSMKNSKGLSLEIEARDKLVDEINNKILLDIDLNSFIKKNQQHDFEDIKKYFLKYFAVHSLPGYAHGLEKIIYTFLCINKIFYSGKKNNTPNIILYVDFFYKFNIFKKYAFDLNINLKKNSYFLKNLIGIFKFYIIFFIKSSTLLKLADKYLIHNSKKINNLPNENIIIELPIQNFIEPYIFKNTNLENSNLIFTNAQHLVSNIDYKDILNNNISYIGMFQRVVRNTKLPFFLKNLNFFYCKKYHFKSVFFLSFSKILTLKLIQSFYIDYNLWYKFFKSTNAKIYFSNYVYSPHIISASLAIKNLNGFSLSNKTSFAETSTGLLSVHTDIFLSLNKNKYIDRDSNNISSYRYNIPVGYYGDYKFKYFQKPSESLRNKIISKGAKFILAFFDQGTYEDTRFHMSHDTACINYKFLFEKLITCEQMGLIIKPKKPKLFLVKIKSIMPLFIKANNTGRLYVELGHDSNSVKNFRKPPCYFAKAADLSIHDTLVSGTAGVEAYLSGSKTVFLDIYGFSNSLFNNSDLNVYFVNIENLWEKIYSNFVLGKNNNLGEWKKLKYIVDQFSDGDCNSRIANIINFINTAILNKESRNQIFKNIDNEFNL